LGTAMKKITVVFICSAVMVLATLALTLVISKFIATIVGSIIASIVLTWVLLSRRAQYAELFSVGVSVAVLGAFLLNIAYYMIWGYVREIYGVRSAIETFLMIVRSGVFLYMFVVDLIISFTSILAVISLVSIMYVGD